MMRFSKSLKLVRRTCCSILMVAVLSTSVGPLAAAGSDKVSYQTILQLQSDKKKDRRSAQKSLIASRDQGWIPGIIDSMFFTPGQRRKETVETLIALAGVDLGTNYHHWVEWIGRHPEIDPRAGYVDFKTQLLMRIDRLYGRIFFHDVPMKIRFEEVVWGGVRVGGIPTLVNPATVSVSDAEYVLDDELVFGAAVNGDYRAYPLRIMDWHEMANDVIGGQPISLSYCTLCRSGILYDTRKPGGGHFVFGTSGVLYRSNKLMVDQGTLSLWSNLTGEPVVGRLTTEPIKLQVLPMTLTTWGEWRSLHPETTVLDLDTLQTQYAFLYEPGVADESRKDVAFPVWQKDSRLDRNTEVYTLIVAAQPKAYPVDKVVAAGVVNDSIRDTEIVLVADSGSGSIRAFVRSGRTFQRNPEGDLVDQSGRRWDVTEEALVSENDQDQEERLLRAPGHVAYWFGWYGFYPSTELWTD